jgi:hypothetical protein
MRLTARDAVRMLDTKKEGFNKALRMIRQMCDSLIRDTCRRSKTRVRFEVPVNVWGGEAYEKNDMGEALAKQLYEDGYDVTGTVSRLEISWGPKKKKKKDEAAEEEGSEEETPRAPQQPFAAPFSTAFSRQLNGKRPRVEVNLSKHV